MASVDAPAAGDAADDANAQEAIEEEERTTTAASATLPPSLVKKDDEEKKNTMMDHHPADDGPTKGDNHTTYTSAGEEESKNKDMMTTEEKEERKKKEGYCSSLVVEEGEEGNDARVVGATNKGSSSSSSQQVDNMEGDDSKGLSASRGAESSSAAVTWASSVTTAATETTMAAANNNNDSTTTSTNGDGDGSTMSQSHRKPEQQQQQQPRKAASLRSTGGGGGDLTILVCTVNMGNTEPTPESFSALVPRGGRRDLVLGKKKEEENNNNNNNNNNNHRPSSAQDDDKTEGEEQPQQPPPPQQPQQQLFDIIAIGMQEAVFATYDLHEIPGYYNRTYLSTSTPPYTLNRELACNKAYYETIDVGMEVSRGANATSILNQLVQTQCPYHECIVHFKRGEMRLILLVRKELVMEVSQLDCRAENTGIGNLLPNKGGIVASFEIRKTSLSFVNAHLEAHEGQSHYRNRCRNATDILNGARTGPSPRWYDASLSNHHCFFFGDLNFRTNFDYLMNDTTTINNGDDDDNDDGGDGDGGGDGGMVMEKEEQKRMARQLINEGDWGGLYKADELNVALAEKECLVGFRTLPCHFPPTFKVKKDTRGHEYVEKRIPSYTDRILWQSLRGLECQLKNMAYHSCPDYISSDHKPVRAAFSLSSNKCVHSESLRRKPGRLRRLRKDNKTFATLTQSVFSRGRQDKVDKSNISTKSNSTTTSRQQRPRINVFLSDFVCEKLEWGGSEVGEKCFIILDTQPDDIVGRSGIGAHPCLDLAAFCRNKKIYKGIPYTRSVPLNGGPSWGEEELVLKLSPNFDNVALQGSMLFVSLIRYDSDPREGDLFGTVRLNLHDVCYPERATRQVYPTSRRNVVAEDDGGGNDDDNDDDVSEDGLYGMHDPILVEEPLMKNGLIQGYIKFTVLVWFLNENDKPSVLDFQSSVHVSRTTDQPYMRRDERLHSKWGHRLDENMGGVS